MYQAVFIDIDGTLIKSNHTLSQENINAVAKLSEKNIPVTLISARPLHGMWQYSNQMQLTNGILASLNGGYIVQNNDIIFDSFMDVDMIAEIHQLLLKYKPSIIYYEKLNWFSDEDNDAAQHEQLITEVPVTIQPFELTLRQWKKRNSGPNKMMIVDSEEDIKIMQAELLSIYGDRFSISTSKPVYLELTNKDASKDQAIQLISKKLNIEIENTVAIGDNYNDKKMLKTAGFGVAMGNAPDEVKAAANFVTDTNNNDGVAKIIDKLLGENLF